MKTLTRQQIETVYKWLTEWEQLKGTVIPLRFKEDFNKQCAAPAVSKCEGLQRKLQLAITGLEIISKKGDGASSEYASELINDIANCC